MLFDIRRPVAVNGTCVVGLLLRGRETLMQRLEVDLVLAEQVLVMTETIQQLSFWESTSSLTVCQCGGGYTLRMGLDAIGTREVAVYDVYQRENVASAGEPAYRTSLCVADTAHMQGPAATSHSAKEQEMQTQKSLTGCLGLV